jgi:ferrous iron transport protein A
MPNSFVALPVSVLLVAGLLLFWPQLGLFARHRRRAAAGDGSLLAPEAVEATPQAETVKSEQGLPLANLPLGRQAWVVGIAQACRGPKRRRLMDLGVLPGTLIKAEFVSPSGDPTAFGIRGAVIALRREEASQVLVEPVAEPTRVEELKEVA